MATIVGTNRDDTLTGTAKADTIRGRGGSDLLFGLDGDDRLDGGPGFNRLDGGAGDDRLNGGEDPDELAGGAGADLLYGGGSYDDLAGGPGDDRAYGGEGDDSFDDPAGADPSGRSGSDLYDGGAGFDEVYHNGSPRGVWVNIAGAAPPGADHDTHRGIEEVQGSRYDDAIRGDGGFNAIRGGYGDDRLYGGAGDDVLDGGDGDNRLFAGAGSDLVGGSSSSPEGEVTGGDDLLDLGADRDADWAFFYQAVDFPQDTRNLFIGSDTVRNFDPARDTLDIQSFDSFGELFVVDVRDFLDSNDDGRVTAADREVSRSGGDLVLDLAALLNRAADVRDPGGPPAFEDVSITLEGIGGGFAAARVAPFDTSLTDAIIRTVVREDGEFPL